MANIVVTVKMSRWRKSVVDAALNALAFLVKAGVPLPANTLDVIVPILGRFLARGMTIKPKTGSPSI